MNRRIASILSVVLLISLLFGFREKGISRDQEFRFDILERIPAYYEGREQPLGSVAKNALSRIRKGTTAYDENKNPIKPIEWLCLTLFGEPDPAPVFKISNQELRAFVLHRRDIDQRIGWKKMVFGDTEDMKLYSYEELNVQLQRIESRTKIALSTDLPKRTLFQRSLIEFSDAIDIYQGLSLSAKLDSIPYLEEIDRLERLAPEGKSAMESRNSGNDYDQEAFDLMMEKWYKYDSIKDGTTLSLIPSKEDEISIAWRKLASVIDELADKGEANSYYRHYAKLADAFRNDDAETFNQTVQDLTKLFQTEFPSSFSKGTFEHEFNNWRLPLSSLATFVISLIGVFVYWLREKPEILTFSYWLSAGGLLILTIEFICRSKSANMPSVFGFYSTSILIAGSAIFMGLALQRRYWNGLSLFSANAIASTFIGTAILTAKISPTIQIPSLDTAINAFTLSHKALLTIGYACTLLAGTIGLLFFAVAIFTQRMNPQAEYRFGTIAYRLVSMSTGFVVAGVLFGCLWAQEAQGQFWAWSPHENSTLLVILWNAIMLHANWGGFTRPRSFLSMAIFGNLLCGFSLMGVGYFTFGTSTFGSVTQTLIPFICFSSINIAGLLLAQFPRSRWRSDFSNA